MALEQIRKLRQVKKRFPHESKGDKSSLLKAVGMNQPIDPLTNWRVFGQNAFGSYASPVTTIPPGGSFDFVLNTPFQNNVKVTGFVGVNVDTPINMEVLYDLQVNGDSVINGPQILFQQPAGGTPSQVGIKLTTFEVLASNFSNPCRKRLGPAVPLLLRLINNSTLLSNSTILAPLIVTGLSLIGEGQIPISRRALREAGKIFKAVWGSVKPKGKMSDLLELQHLVNVSNEGGNNVTTPSNTIQPNSANALNLRVFAGDSQLALRFDIITQDFDFLAMAPSLDIVVQRTDDSGNNLTTIVSQMPFMRSSQAFSSVEALYERRTQAITFADTVPLIGVYYRYLVWLLNSSVDNLGQPVQIELQHQDFLATSPVPTMGYLLNQGQLWQTRLIANQIYPPLSSLPLASLLPRESAMFELTVPPLSAQTEINITLSIRLSGLIAGTILLIKEQFFINGEAIPYTGGANSEATPITITLPHDVVRDLSYDHVVGENPISEDPAASGVSATQAVPQYIEFQFTNDSSGSATRVDVLSFSFVGVNVSSQKLISVLP